MTLFEYFRMTFGAITQITLIGLCGYIFARRKIINEEILKLISKGVINVFFPCYIFVSLITNFNFHSHPKWWIFPLGSIFITFIGFLTGLVFIYVRPELKRNKREFISLVTFQNSGYLPLMLVSIMFPPGRREYLIVSIFLFLLGFNFIFWSFAPYYLGGRKEKRIKIIRLFSPPVTTTLICLFLIAIGVAKFIPLFLIGPAEMFGNCALPLAILVVGGNLALIITKTKKPIMDITYLLVAKLLVLPLICLAFIFLLRPPRDLALLLFLQGTMPSAASLGVVVRQYQTSDHIISLGTFWTHIVGLITIPLCLAIFGVFLIHLK